VTPVCVLDLLKIWYNHLFDDIEPGTILVEAQEAIVGCLLLRRVEAIVEFHNFDQVCFEKPLYLNYVIWARIFLVKAQTVFLVGGVSFCDSLVSADIVVKLLW
jgi:hypothetical protein